MPRPTVLLFDVDGTLISTDGAGRRAIERAFERRYGGTDACAHIAFGGMTDRAIARAGLTALGIEPTEAEIAALLAEYVRGLDSELHASANFRVIAGIERALAATAGLAHVAVGLGTGNVRAGAHKKLSHARLWHHFAFGGFADDSESRPELVRAGAARGADRLGAPLAACRVVVIGDTPLDVAAARANGFECLAVATGFTPAPALAAAGATRVFASLDDEEAIEELLDSA